jgi:hypothetical protein
VSEILLTILLYALALFVGYGIAMLRQLRAIERILEVWQFDLELVEYPENIHRSTAYKTAIEMMLTVTRPPFRRRRSV